MNILQLAITKTWGGGGIQMENLCHGISKLSPEINITFFCAKNTILHQRLKASSFNYSTAPLRTKIDPRFIFKLISFCKRKKIDLIHIHGPSALMVAIIADKIGNLPPFVFSKKTAFPIKKRRQTLYKYNYHKIKKIICVSKQVEKVMQDPIKDKDKLIVIYDGMQFNKLTSKTSFLLREKFDIHPTKKIIGNIANHIDAKDLNTFINVMDTVINIEKRNDFHFIQIGSFSTLTNTLKNKIKALKLEKSIHFLNYIPDASNFIPQFDTLLITSKSEGLGLVILESFYHKTPVVSTTVGIAPEIIENGKNGMLAATQDHATLAEHIINLTSDPVLKNQFTTVSFKKLFPKFELETMSEKTLEVYKEVINYNC